jgi:hypothetical protein
MYSFCSALFIRQKKHKLHLSTHEPPPASKAKKNKRGWGQGGEMTQTLYAHMNNKTIKKKKKKEQERQVAAPLGPMLES